MKNKCIVIVISVFFLGLTIWNLFAKTPDYSNSERRKLADFPDLNVESVLSGEFSKAFETYAVERFAVRDLWRSVKAYTATGVFQQKDNHGIYQAEGHISKIEYPMNEPMLDYAIEVLTNVNEKYLDDSKAYLAVIPDKNCYLAAENGYLTMDYPAFSSYMADEMDFAAYIEIADLLEAEDYYKTDTHWRQEQIVDVAERLLVSMGAPANESQENSIEEYKYTIQTMEQPFEGVYVGQSALRCEPDTIFYLENEVTRQARVEIIGSSTQNLGEAYTSVYNMELASGRDPYELFLSGNQPIIRVQNPMNESGRRLILFRDSFGSSIAPLLMAGYSEIVLVDLRYVGSDQLADFVAFEDADVLFLYSTMLLNNSLSLK